MSEPRTFTVFRLAGAFEPKLVTQLLGIEPSGAHARGDLRADGRRRWEWSRWALSTEALDSDRIEPHLDWLLDRIEPCAERLQQFRTPEIEVVLDCFWGSVGMGGGPWIPPSAMRRLGALDLPLLVSFYYEEEPELVEADSGSTD